MYIHFIHACRRAYTPIYGCVCLHTHMFMPFHSFYMYITYIYIYIYIQGYIHMYHGNMCTIVEIYMQTYVYATTGHLGSYTLKQENGGPQASIPKPERAWWVKDGEYQICVQARPAHLYIYTSIYTYICIYIYTYISSCILQAYAYLYKFVHLGSLCTRTHTDMCMYMYIGISCDIHASTCVCNRRATMQLHTQCKLEPWKGLMGG